ncbi:hypothetical protein [Streptomyces olivaceus]|uniref:hypothetical protein n=1 Tax=Streptomyces olivaceus TaxID=47716 RepID=UPI0040573C1B
MFPTYEVIGTAAPILLAGLRLLQVLGAGAETASASAVTYECADRKKTADADSVGVSLSDMASTADR